MIEGLLGIVDKMRIEVFETIAFESTQPFKTIFVQVNPESYTINHEVQFHDGQTMGSSGQELQFNRIGSEEVTFDFVFDSSGVIPPSRIKDGRVEHLPLTDTLVDVLKPAIANPFEQAATIDNQLKEFKELVSGYNGDTHQTRYLRLIWGKFLLECRLTNISVEYKVFGKDGRPIRANAVCTFKGTQSYGEMQAEQNRQSPDVTHSKTVNQKDKITLMAEQTYHSNTFYVDVAKANQLLSFRDLKTGQNLRFPPIK